MTKEELDAIKNYIHAYSHKIRPDIEGSDLYSTVRHEAYDKLRHAADELEALVDKPLELNQSSMQMVPIKMSSAMREELNSRLGDHQYGTAQDVWDIVLEINRKEQLYAINCE